MFLFIGPLVLFVLTDLPEQKVNPREDLNRNTDRDLVTRPYKMGAVIPRNKSIRVSRTSIIKLVEIGRTDEYLTRTTSIVIYFMFVCVSPIINVWIV